MKTAIAATSFALATTVSADFTGLTLEPFVGEGWIQNGYNREALTTYRLYAEFSEQGDNGVLSVFGISGVPMSVQSSDDSFWNPEEGLDSLTAPNDLRFLDIWENQWDTYVTIGTDNSTDDATTTSPGFANETNNLASNWVSENVGWFVTPDDDQSRARNGRVYIAQFTVATGENVSGIVNLLLRDNNQPEGLVFSHNACLLPSLVLPHDFDFIGVYHLGTLSSLFESDDDRLVLDRDMGVWHGDPAIEVTVTTTVPADTVLDLTFWVEAHATYEPPVIPQQVELFNFAFDQWDPVDLRSATLEDRVVEIVITDGANQYVEPGTAQMLARVRWFDPLGADEWSVGVDQMIWGVTPDCNSNGFDDCEDIESGTSVDCNGNGIPDECEADCNDNGIHDDCDIEEGRSEDCNENRVPDECDIDEGTSQDWDGNGVPDECECIADVTQNGRVDVADLIDVLSAWGECESCREDINNDGVVAIRDLLIVLAAWGPCPE